MPFTRILPPLLAFALAAAPVPASAEDFPRQGYDGAPNGLAEPFIGNWRMGFPEPEGTIVAATIVGCDDPVRIEAVDETHISFASPAMETPALFEVYAFEGRTTWYPDDNSATYITVWLTPDSFHLHDTDMGRANWDDARLMQRCEAG